MQKLLFSIVALIIAGHAAAARETAHARSSGYLTRISCETVRAYVAEVGLTRARAVAVAHGMTATEEREARRCLAAGN